MRSTPGRLCAQTRRAARHCQQRVSGSGLHGGIDPLVGSAGGVDGEAVVHPRSNSEEGLRAGHGDQIVVGGAVSDSGACSAATTDSQSPTAETLLTEMSASSGLASSTVTRVSRAATSVSTA